MTTRTLPTDKYGNVYHGESRYSEACETARFFQNDYFADRITEEQMRAGWERIESRLRGAGYTGIADRFKREWLEIS